MSNQLENRNHSGHALITGKVMKNINNLALRGELTFPENYNVANAVQAAYLKIKETKDKNGRPALEACTTESIVQAVMNMAVQGLNPMKNQCYFIAYGQTLTMQRSYFGSIALAKQLNPKIVDIFAEIVYEGDTFKIGRRRGKTIVIEHITELENIDKSKIKAAYATAVYENGEEESELMTIDQIHQAWRMSKMAVFTEKGTLSQKSTHYKFTEEMAKKSVINRLCKKLINSTDDSILSKSIKATDEQKAISEAKENVENYANKEDFIDIDVTEAEPPKQIEQAEEAPNFDTETGEILTETVVEELPVEEPLGEAVPQSLEELF